MSLWASPLHNKVWCSLVPFLIVLDFLLFEGNFILQRNCAKLSPNSHSQQFQWSRFRMIPTTYSVKLLSLLLLFLLPPNLRAMRAMYHVGEFRNCRMSGTSRAGWPAWRKKGWWSSSAAVARCDGSRTNILSKNPCIRGETWKMYAKIVIGKTLFELSIGK